jgi:cell wall-associated NlpC family hydrolase
MKTAVLITGIAAGPFLLAVPAVVAGAGHASALCSFTGARAVDAVAVARQVHRVLRGAGTSPTSVPGLDRPREQIWNARVITATGMALRVPARGRVVAMATALTESRLLNLAYGDRDSLGLFQQRPSQEWGSAEQVRDPVYASTAFYERLVRVRGWESLTVAQAAQAVQKSSRPGAYARWEPLASALEKTVAVKLAKASRSRSVRPVTVAGRAAGARAPGCRDSGDGPGFGSVPDGALPAGYTLPRHAPRKVRAAIRWALGQLGTPYQWGGACTEPHGRDPMRRCDCSSLVQAAYRAAGVRLARTTYEQVKQGKAVPLGGLRPGDLVFTQGSAAAPEHVGMVIGSGLLVNAPRTGDVVRVATLASWKRQILAARRVA